jgi:hypothetical protein
MHHIEGGNAAVGRLREGELADADASPSTRRPR